MWPRTENRGRTRGRPLPSCGTPCPTEKNAIGKIAKMPPEG